MKTLWSLIENEINTLQKFDPTLEEGYVLRLQELGFEVGVCVRCIQKTPFGGPRVYQVRDSYFSLDQEIAVKIFIK